VRNVVERIIQKIKTHLFRSIAFVLENCAIYEIMWNNSVEPERTQMIKWRKRIAS